MTSPLDLLAAYLTGMEVGHQSVGLEMPEGSRSRQRATSFFELRRSFGVVGYESADKAKDAIIAALAIDLRVLNSATLPGPSASLSKSGQIEWHRDRIERIRRDLRN